MRYSVEVEQIDALEKYKITTVSKPSRFLRLFGVTSKTRTYLGECTVWYETTDGKFQRAGTVTESFLSDIEAQFEYQKILKEKK